MSSPSIILETNSFVALNKPVGWVINDSKTAHGNPTVQNWVSENISSDLSTNFSLRNGIVHRLDKETSGVLLVAKTQDALNALQSQFASRLTQKTYVALVHGTLTAKGTINAPIARNPKNRTKFSVVLNGRASETQYEVVKGIKREGENYTLLKLHPKTGRTHQLRVHMSHIKHPIVGDTLYGGRKTARRDRAWCDRLFLHAQALEFTDPVTQKRVLVEAPLPKELQEIV